MREGRAPRGASHSRRRSRRSAARRSRVRYRGATRLGEPRLHRVPGDGNCQFHAVAHALSQHPSRAREVSPAALRHAAAHHIQTHPKLHAFADYDVSTLHRDGVYGDHLTLHALATVLNTDILVMQPDGREVLITGARTQAHGTPLILFHRPEAHYDSVLI